MGVKRTTISVPESVLKVGQNRADRFHMSFSDYITRLVQQDIQSGSDQITITAETPPEFKVKKLKTRSGVEPDQPRKTKNG